jgi:flagellar biosynthetic protein FliQ
VETLTIADAFQRALLVMTLGSMPLLLTAMGVGMLIGILQTATSIQEQTLTFIPKLLAVVAMLALLGPWLFSLVGDLAISLFTDLYKYVG